LAGALPQTPLGSSQHFPRPPSWIQEVLLLKKGEGKRKRGKEGKEKGKGGEKERKGGERGKGDIPPPLG